MSCPVCDHTMQNLGVSDAKDCRTFWCNRCGTIKTDSQATGDELVDEPLWIAGPEFNRVEVLAIVKREPRMAEHIKRLDWQPPENDGPSAPS